jgi:capsular exopolysaccharide synthesis family protein
MDQYDQSTEEQNETQDPRFRELIAIILRNRWLILASSVGAMILSAIYALNQPPVCEASTIVLINSKAGQQANPFAQGAEGTTNKLANEMAILKARGLARNVALSLLASPRLDSSGARVMPILRHDPKDVNSAALADADLITDRLQRVVAFLPEKESDVIKITAMSSDAREAARIANAYADMYVDQIMQQSRSRSRSVREFLEGRLTDQRAQLRQAEGAVKQLMESSGVVSLDAESNRLVQELSQLEATRNSLSVEIEGLSMKVNSLQSELPQQETSVANAIGQASDPYIKTLGDRIAALEVQRDVMIAQNEPAILSQAANQAKLKEINDQIDQLRENLRKKTTELIWGTSGSGSTGTQADPLDYIRGLRQQLLEGKIQLETLRSRRVALQRIIDGYENKFHKIPQQSMDLARVQRERLSTEKLYGLVEEKFNEAAITEKSEFGYVDIVDRATAEGSTYRSSVVRNTLLGLVVGLGLALAIVFVKEAVDLRVRTPEQVRRLKYTALAEIRGFHDELKKTKIDEEHLPANASQFAPQVRLVFHPLSFTAESYRRLRTNILRANMKQPLKSLLVTSPNPQEGKSTTLVNLGISLAETDQKVLVIDTDLRMPTVHTLLGIPRAPGFSDIIDSEASPESVIHKDVIPNLDVLTCGTAVRNPARFFGLTKPDTIVKSLRDQYDWVLMDAPPILVVNDASVLSSIVDATVLVVDAGVTRLEALERASMILRDSEGRFLGVVLNNFDPKAAYGAYYGSTRYGHYEDNHAYYRVDDGSNETL